MYEDSSKLLKDLSEAQLWKTYCGKSCQTRKLLMRACIEIARLNELADVVQSAETQNLKF